jgi:hypothetical protein
MNMTQGEAEWRELLVKYCAIVSQSEGVDFRR